ncbi:MAG: sigma-54 dependent transcriptional regulator [Catalinimonas sp.]
MSGAACTRIFVVEDDALNAAMARRALEREEKYDVTVYESGQAFFKDLYRNPDIVVLDYHLPDINGVELLKGIQDYNPDIACVVLSGQETAEVVVEAYRNGARHYILKNEKAYVELANSVRNLNRNVALRREVESLRESIIERSRYKYIVGESPAMLKVMKMMQKVERTDMMVLISGESGTGKEVIAKSLHYNSPRVRKPYIPVNMAAIPEDLIEDELFGHEKGAFTGADSRRIGKFEEAHGGTILLDEIGELDLNLQAKLLRVLQEQTITRLGSNKQVKLNVRILAATNKNLATLVKEGKFREDLYYRLQGFLLHLPPLRKRDNDVVLLANHFLKKASSSGWQGGKSFSRDAIEKLLKHSWPGNVRELQSVVQRAFLLSETQCITADDLIFSDVI